ncbi:MAG: hypothetical protein ABIJ75_10645 [Actinomycetota bacterium]
MATRTPWGPAQDVTEYPGGIRFYRTASHGGFKVPEALLGRIPYKVRAGTWGSMGLGGWFEEDVDAAIVPVFFPESFTPEQVAAVRAYRLLVELRLDEWRADRAS